MISPYQNYGFPGAYGNMPYCGPATGQFPGTMMSPGLSSLSGLGGLGNSNSLWALSGMMRMLEMLMAMTGAERAGELVGGNVLLPGTNPGFGSAGAHPLCDPSCGSGMQDFLGGFAPVSGGRGWSGASYANGNFGYSAASCGQDCGGPLVAGPCASVAHGPSSEQGAPGATEMLAHAGSMIGLRGDRDRDEIKKITGRSGLDPSKSPWCAAFAMNMLDEHKLLDLDGLTNRNYCPTIENWARGKGIYGTPDRYQPKPGDAILFDWAGERGKTDHIGIVEKIENGKVYTIEGNNKNSVRRAVYRLDDRRIDGYVVTRDKQQAGKV
jgi:hypothetical protein